MGLRASSRFQRRIGNAVVELVALKLVVIQRIAELHIVRVTATDEHISLGNAKGKGIHLLTKAGNIRIGIKLQKPFIHAGEHLACSHGHIINCLCDTTVNKGSFYLPIQEGRTSGR